MIQKDTMDRLLAFSQITLEMSEIQKDLTGFIFRLRVNRYQYGMKGLPYLEIRLSLWKDKNYLYWQLPAGDFSADAKVWNKLFGAYSDEDIEYYFKKIYERLINIAKTRGLTKGTGVVFQLCQKAI